MRRSCAFVLSAGVVLCFACAASSSPADYVDPFIGTAGTGHTFPAAACPFGLVQAGPDTGNRGWDYCSGYRYPDGQIIAFSQTHLNGTGCSDLGDLGLMPFRGENPVASSFSHDEETARPGYYSVVLKEAAVRVEIAAAAHTSIYRIVGEGRVNVLVDPTYGIGRVVTKKGRLITPRRELSSVSEEGTCLSGVVDRRGWVSRSYSYVVSFDRPARMSVIASDPDRRVCSFDLLPDKPLLLKVALSAKGGAEGVEAAKANLAAEIPGWDFDAVRKKAASLWDKYLNRVEIEGSDAQKKSFYTALYHLFIQPNNIADVGEKPFYSTFSCWDTFRAAGPLYTVLTPELVPDMIDSMLRQGRITGYLPIWTLWGKENQCMIGTHSVPMIVDAWLKGFPMDAQAAYRQIHDTLKNRHPERKKEMWDVLDRYGYYPLNLVRTESVSRTMECAYDDWCAGVMAEKLGFAEDADFFFRRSTAWKNVFDPSLGLVRGKDAKGAWRNPYNPYALGSGWTQDNDFTEGNAFQYSWHVMQDPQGLVAAMGGREKFLAKLDSIFTESSQAEGMGSVKDVTGLIGQYVHGNEPSHHILYFYPLLGESDKAAERIREVFDKLYQPKPDGLCGNEDCGQMSAWYLFSAMGFYPFNPCGGEYVIGAPQVEKVTLRIPSTNDHLPSTNYQLPTTNSFTIVAKNLSKENKYVKSVSLNGHPLENRTIRHAELVKGGTFVFEMTGSAK